MGLTATKTVLIEFPPITYVALHNKKISFARKL
jgi:hypothetical protein